jgi:outer membrane receptor for ferrienterochelin and colicin
MLFLIPGLLLAGITGKLTGRVKDAGTGEPLPMANVIVRGTDQGAATGLDGTYVISNIRAGTYTVEFSMVGYQTVVANNVKITADQLTKQDAKLSSGSIQMGVVEVTAERDLLAVEPTAVTNREISRMSVDNFEQLVALQAGATESTGANSAGLHIYGGRKNEVVYVVDGINANDPVTGQSGVYIDNSAIQEMTTNTGTFNAEYGDAMSAVVNIITREGGARFQGTVEYETDAHLRLSKDPVKYPNPDMWHNKGSLSLGGPLGLPRATFFISGNILEHENRLLFSDQHRYNGTLKLAWRPIKTGPKFTLSGNYANQWYHSYSHGYSKGVWLGMGPRSKRDNYQLNLKVNHPVTEKVSYTINVGTFNTHHKVSYMDGSHYNDFRMIGRQMLDWVGWAYGRTWWEDLEIPDTTITDEGDTVITDRVFKRLYDADSMRFVFKADSTFYAGLKENGDTNWVNLWERYGHITEDSDSMAWFYYNEFISGNGYLIDHGDGTYDNVYRWIGLEEQLEALNNRWYEINEWRPSIGENGDTVGVHYHLFDFDLYKHYYKLYQEFPDSSYYDPVSGDSVHVDNPYEDSLETSGNLYYVRYNSDPLFRRFRYYFYPYWAERNTTKYIADASVDWNPNEVHWFKVGASGNYHVLNYDMINFVNENPYNDTYNKKPIIAAAYVQDKVEYEDLVLHAGIRFDYFDPASDFFIDPENIDSGKVAAKPKFQFSPRISVSFAVSEKAKMHASYGHFFQPVTLRDLYENLSADITVGVPLLGNPNLPPLKTVFYQAGYKYMVSKNMVFELKGFFKDQENLLATRSVSTIYKGELASYTVYVIEDFAKIKGIDIGVRRRAPKHKYLSWDIVYSFMDAKGTGSSGREFYYRYRGTALEPPKHEYPLEFDITHSLKANLNFYLDHEFDVKALRRTNLNVQFNYASGSPYWATDSRGSVLPMGTKRKPGTKTVDAKLEKWFSLGEKLNLGTYVDVRNLVGWTNVASVYGGTGLPDDNGNSPVYEPSNYRGYAGNGFSDEMENWEADVADWERYYAQNPGMFGGPRELRFGIRMSF